MPAQPAPQPAPVVPLSPDLVVVVPGIMGSALEIAESRKRLWGLSVPWYVDALRSPRVWDLLKLDDNERAGRYGRVKATGLLKFHPAISLFLGGFEPYSALVDSLDKVTLDGAIVEFPYDWRLPVQYNAGLLATVIAERFAAWTQLEAVKNAAGAINRAPRVIVIAHSMGGLVFRALLGTRELTSVVGDVSFGPVLTLGTPFLGAAKALLTIANGVGSPFPMRRDYVREMARTLPGVYDLLPLYRAVDTGTDFRRLTADDVAAVGGSGELAEAALNRQQELRATYLSEATRHLAYVGAFQPTDTSVRLDAGAAHGLRHTYQLDGNGDISRDRNGNPERRLELGDTTVPIWSGTAHGQDSHLLIQKHGSLASVKESQAQALGILRGFADPQPHHHIIRPHAGADTVDDRLGVDAPDAFRVGEATWVPISGVPLSSLTGTLANADGARAKRPIRFEQRDGEVGAVVEVPAEGAYRLDITSADSRDTVTHYALAFSDDG